MRHVILLSLYVAHSTVSPPPRADQNIPPIPMFLLVLVASLASALAQNYAVVVDAGSTGSRAFIYEFRHDANGGRHISALHVQKVMPGLSSFGEHPQDAVAYLAPLLHNAASVIDPSHHNQTKVYIKATAGMRCDMQPLHVVLPDLSRSSLDLFQRSSRGQYGML